MTSTIFVVRDLVGQGDRFWLFRPYILSPLRPLLRSEYQSVHRADCVPILVAKYV